MQIFFFLIEREKKNILFKSEKQEAWEPVCVCERERRWLKWRKREYYWTYQRASESASIYFIGNISAYFME